MPLDPPDAVSGGGPLPRPYYDIYDPFLALNTAAAVTTKLKIGTGICLVVQRDPIVTAKMVSSIDQLSNGRFLFGVGNGWNRTRSKTTAPSSQPATSWRASGSRRCRRSGPRTNPRMKANSCKFGPMSQWPKPVQKPLSADHRRRRLPVCRAPRHPLRQRLDSARRPAGARRRRRASSRNFATWRPRPGATPLPCRSPSSASLTTSTKLRFCQEIGVDRVVFSLPAEKEDKIMPILDRWVEVKRTLGILIAAQQLSAARSINRLRCKLPVLKEGNEHATTTRLPAADPRSNHGGPPGDRSPPEARRTSRGPRLRLPLGRRLADRSAPPRTADAACRGIGPNAGV